MIKHGTTLALMLTPSPTPNTRNVVASHDNQAPMLLFFPPHPRTRRVDQRPLAVQSWVVQRIGVLREGRLHSSQSFHELGLLGLLKLARRLVALLQKGLDGWQGRTVSAKVGGKSEKNPSVALKTK